MSKLEEGRRKKARRQKGIGEKRGRDQPTSTPEGAQEAVQAEEGEKHQKGHSAKGKLDAEQPTG
jgi:hypothetical protein